MKIFIAIGLVVLLLCQVNANELKKCQKACGGGVRKIQNFCRRIRHPVVKAGCWAIVYAGPTACKNWCYWQYSDK